MTADIAHLKQLTESQAGCSLQKAIHEIPWSERLQALKDLKTSLGEHSRFDVEIAGNTPNHFAYRIKNHVDSNAEFESMAQSMSLDADTVKALRELKAKAAAQTPRGAELMASESFGYEVTASSTSPNSLQLDFGSNYNRQCSGR